VQRRDGCNSGASAITICFTPIQGSWLLRPDSAAHHDSRRIITLIILAAVCRFNFSKWAVSLNSKPPGIEKLLPPSDMRWRKDISLLEEGQYQQVLVYLAYQKFYKIDRASFRLLEVLEIRAAASQQHVLANGPLPVKGRIVSAGLLRAHLHSSEAVSDATAWQSFV